MHPLIAIHVHHSIDHRFLSTPSPFYFYPAPKPFVEASIIVCHTEQSSSRDIEYECIYTMQLSVCQCVVQCV